MAPGARRTPLTARWRVLLPAVCVLGASISLAACAEPPVLEVGPVGYSAEDLAFMSDEQRQKLVDLTAFGLAVAGDRTDEMIAPFVDRELASLTLQRLAMEVAVEDAGMDESALREAYDRAPVPELVVRHLVVMSERWRPEEHRDSARAVAEEALERARTGDDFEALAAEYSDEPGAAERGGLLEPGREGSWAREFWAAANALEEGELSPLVETEFGFHVIRLEERRAVPFEDVREDVLERFVDLPSALSRTEDWVESQAAGLRLDTSAVAAWRAGEPVDRPVATWQGEAPGSLSPESLDLYVATLDEQARAQAADADGSAAVDLVTAAARNRMLLARAGHMGLEPSGTTRAAVERRWEERVARWAEELGFRRGQSENETRAAALEALGAQPQGTAIARRQIGEVAGRLRMLYPVQSPSSADVVNSDTSA